jgi:hypothetical protein
MLDYEARSKNQDFKEGREEIVGANNTYYSSLLDSHKLKD